MSLPCTNLYVQQDQNQDHYFSKASEILVQIAQMYKNKNYI